MADFILVTLRWYDGGVLDLSSGKPNYIGGEVTEFLDVDVDMMSYFELRDYIKQLGYTTTCTFSIKPPNSGILEDVSDKDILDMCMSLEDGDMEEVYVHHMIDRAVSKDMINKKKYILQSSVTDKFHTFEEYSSKIVKHLAINASLYPTHRLKLNRANNINCNPTTKLSKGSQIPNPTSKLNLLQLPFVGSSKYTNLFTDSFI